MKNKKFTNLLTLGFAFLAMLSVSAVTGQVVTCTTTGVSVTINTGTDPFAGEVGWELFNVTTGEVVAYESTGFPLGTNQSVTFNAPGGNYELYGYDTFGDNWNGFDIEIVSNGQVVCSGNSVVGPGNGGNNAGVFCGGGFNNGTQVCASFFLGAASCAVDCPTDIEVDNDPGQCGAFVNVPAPTLGAECVSVTNDFNGTPDPSGFYPVGTTEVTVTGFDADGIPGDCTFTVTVNDTEGPTFASCSNDITINLDAGECDYIFNLDIEDVTDNCPPSAGACTQASDTVTVDDAFACFIDEFSYMQIFPKDVCGGSPTGDVNLEFARTGITWLSAPQDVSVNIYGYNQADPFEMANLDLVFTQVETFPLSPFPALGGPSDKYTVNFASPAVVDGSYDSYVVEMVCPAVGFGNFPFTLNDGGALSDTYWRALNGPNGCGDFEPEEIGAASGGILQGTDWLLVIGASSSFNVTNCGDVEDGDFLEEGEYNVCYEAEDGAGNVGRCEYTLTVQNFPNPSQSLACNDHVNVSVDNSCEAIINADMILEGGPYSCYRDYIVQLATDMDFNNIIASSEVGDEGAVVGSAQVGNTYFVRVIDPETGNSCWGTITIEDKFIPELSCSSFPVDCGADTTPGAGGATTLVLDDANGEIVIDPFVTGDYPATADASVAGVAEITNVSVRLVTDHTWVGDLSGSVESPSGTVVNLFPNPNCTNTGLDVLFDDAAANTNADFLATCNNNPAIEGEFQPQDALAAFNGENPDGEWTITINDGAFGDGGTFSVAEIIIDYNFEIPFPFEFTGTSTPIDENSFVVSGFDACGDVTASYEDNITNIDDCDSEFSDRIFRNWTVVDESGNTVTCQDTIDVVRTSLEDLTFPPNFDGIDQPALSCDGDNWDLNENGYPDPEETGAPSDQICDNILTTPKDQVIDVCEGTFKVLRTWTFLDWCTSETVTHVQLIKVEDVEGPEIDCPATATVSTATNSCVATYSVPDISGNITDECSPSSSFWTVESSAGEVIDFGNQVFQIINLPVGTHTLTYSADDGCGNLATCEQTLIVQDAVPPVAVCDQNTKVTLGADGTARVFWPTFEDGSYDNCAIDRIEVTNES